MAKRDALLRYTWRRNRKVLIMILEMEYKEHLQTSDLGSPRSEIRNAYLYTIAHISVLLLSKSLTLFISYLR
jgi:hypothetical protein